MSSKPFKVAEKIRAAASAAKAGDLGNAEAAYAEVLARFPGNAKAKAGLKEVRAQTLAQPPDRIIAAAHAAEAQGDLARAERLLTDLLALVPGRLDAQSDLGLVLTQAGQAERAIDVLSDLTRKAPRIPEGHINLAQAYAQAGRLQDAQASCEAALTLAPTHPVALCNLGSLCAQLGDMDRALSCYETSIRHNPGYADAYVNYGNAKTFTADDPVLAAMQAALAGGKLPDHERVKLHFALGKALDDLGDVDPAFDQYRQANDLARATRAFDPDHELAVVDQLTARYGAPDLPFLEPGTTPPGPVRPIFIIGMPRSGSTLIERVLSSHSQVFGAGEIGDLREIETAVMEGASQVDRAALGRIRAAYLERLQGMAEGAPVVVDKNLMNFHFVGLIAAAFPEAVILHMRRDPVAVCWSNYRQNFASDRLSFTNDLGSLGAYYTRYTKAMEMWHAGWSGRIMDVDYEAFTRDPEAQTRVLLENCGLGFEEACLRAQESRAAARTASLYQVRKPVYQGSSRAWEAYRAHLTPLLEALPGGDQAD